MNEADFIKAFEARMAKQQDVTSHDVDVAYHPKHGIRYFRALLIHKGFLQAKFLSVKFDDNLTLDKLMQVIKEINWNSSAYSATKRQDHV